MSSLRLGHALVALSLLVAGCGDDDQPDAGRDLPRLYPIPGCKAHDPAPCQVSTPACQARLWGLTLCLRGEPDQEPPVVSTMTEAEYAALLEAELAELEPPPSPNHFERALVALGLATTGDLTPERTITRYVTNVYGFYRFETRDVVVIERPEARELTTQSAVLVHEYVHVLQDRSVGLDAFFDERATSMDAYLAADALVEGEAELHQARYMTSALGLVPETTDLGRRFQNLVEWSETTLVDEPSPYVTGNLLFPYVWGARFTHLAWKAGGPPAILEQFASPPAATRVLLESVNEAHTAAVSPAVIPVPAEPAEWTPFTQAKLGGFGAFLVVLHWTRDPLRARRAGSALRGDLLSVFQGTEPAATALSYRMDFEDDATAEAVRAVLATRFGTDVRVQGTHVTLALSTRPANLDWAYAW